MSSLSVIKIELEQVDELLGVEVTKQVELEEQLENQKSTVEVVKKHYDKLTRALSILNGAEVEDSPPSATTLVSRVEQPVTPTAVPAPPPRRKLGPTCSACNDEMTRLGRTTRSGAYIEYWSCPGCSNEQY